MLAEIMVLARTRFPAANLGRPVRAAADVVSGPGGIIGPVAEPLFHQYLLAFELTSMLLLTAIVGAVVIGKKGGTDAR
jgi:NADH:ubiquinone oxidoreductase subunit 6 (subunit J)